MVLANIKAVASTLFGEAPHWNAKNQDLVYVDYLGKAICRYVPKTGQEFKVDVGSSTSVVIPVDEQDNKYLISQGCQLKLLDWDGENKKAGDLKLIGPCPKEALLNKCMFNDGKCDNQGRFWIGTAGGLTKDGAINPIKGNLYNLSSDCGSWTSHVDNVELTNGMGWSTDSSKFYYVDSLKNRIDAFDFDPDQPSLSNRQVLYDFKKNKTAGIADGLTMDAQNNVWVASYLGAKVLHIDTTTGQLIEEIDFKDRTNFITSVAFGGANLDILYVTSGTVEFPGFVTEIVQSDQKEAGALFEVTNIGAKGIMGASINFKGKLPSN